MDLIRDAKAAEIRKLVVELVRAVIRKGAPERVGIGFGGPVDTESGRIVRSFQVADWEGFPLRAWAEEQFGLPCLIESGEIKPQQHLFQMYTGLKAKGACIYFAAINHWEDCS